MTINSVILREKGMIQFNINSEIGRLQAVLIHEPGPEVENMSPATAERALYSDILNLSVTSKEYRQFKHILKKFTTVFEIRDLLHSVISIPEAKNQFISDLAGYTGNPYLADQLMKLSDKEFCTQIIEGVPSTQNSLRNFLNKHKYLISPLHNAFFTRDSSFIIGDTAYIGNMAKKIREPETLLLNILLTYSPDFSGEIEKLSQPLSSGAQYSTIEGGDVLVVDKDVLLVGIGSRSSAQGVDDLIYKILQKSDLHYVIVQELPDQPESFIHLDMVFTLLNEDECMIYIPLLLNESKYHTVLMKIENRVIKQIEYTDNILIGLKKAGHDLKPISCGGSELLLQEREQWHSGANFLAIDPGKIIGYGRNTHTSEELNKHGYEIRKAEDVINSNLSLDDLGKTLITIDGSELSRGGGGTRCMSMPLVRA
jgi:arginine deiminase